MITSSRSFDRAANFYDQTRELSEPVATHGIPALLQHIAPRGRILDVGTGTGRISIPLQRLDADVIGIDLSLSMMGKLREKYPAARLVQADASRLPFPARYFDAVLTTHVMHLIGPWRDALREYRRVLKPGGIYIDALTWLDDSSVIPRLRGRWRTLVEGHGVAWRTPGVQKREDLATELQVLGARSDDVEVLRYQASVAPREVLDLIRGRLSSDTWEIPDDVFTATVAEVTAWAEQEYGDLDKPLSEERRFILRIARFE
jgi:SAM-dependent methyltransferase